MRTLRILFLNIILLFAMYGYAFPATLHVIFVINTEDKGIGCENDLKNWETLLPEIEKYSGMKIEKHYLKDKTWSDKDVNKTIEKIKVAPDDAIIFYYSGHGFRFQDNQKDQWPYMALQDSVMSLYVLYSNLHKKNARLLIVIADCCNSYCPGSPPEFAQKGKVSEELIAENYKNLFLKAKGTIIASGCIPGQYSYGGDPDGGAYTSTLITTIKLSVRNEGATWKQIFEGSNKPLVGGKQQPQYQMDVDPLNSVINSDIADNKTDNAESSDAGGDVSFDELEDPGWCSQAMETRNIFNNAIVLLEAEKYLPANSNEYKKLLDYTEMQFGFAKDQYNDAESAKYWQSCIDLVKSCSKKGLSNEKYSEIMQFLKDEQKQWLDVINQKACVKKAKNKSKSKKK